MPRPRQRLTRATFWFDGARERVQGWTDGSTWNNWGVPLFDDRQLPAAIRALSAVGFRVAQVGPILWLKHEDDNYETDYPSEKVEGKRYWRIGGLTWNHTTQQRGRVRQEASGRRGATVRAGARGLDLPGWSVGYHDEINAHAAIRSLPGKRNLLFVMTSDDREPRSLDDEVTVGLYFFDGDSWEQIGYRDFPSVSAVVRLSNAALYGLLST